MTFTDGLHYIAVGNPVSKAIIGSTASLFGRSSSTAAAKVTMASKTVNNALPQLWKLAGRNYNFVRLAGLSGASAVVLGAIGSHKLDIYSDKGETKNIFETANRFHFLHSLALLGMPLVKYPVVTGSLMVTGTFLFSGALYYRAFTGKGQYARFAPMGGTCLIVAWLTLLL